MYTHIYKYCFCKLIVSFSSSQSSPTPSYPKDIVASSAGDPPYTLRPIQNTAQKVCFFQTSFLLCTSVCLQLYPALTL